MSIHHISRPTVMAAAFTSINIFPRRDEHIREAKMAVLSAPSDKSKPSVWSLIRTVRPESVPGAFGKKHSHSADYDRALAAVARRA